ncbi:glutamate 5-kinase [Edaphobacillus lindanitolerans]|uniref:Glutamate 5-kinase n=1 Tax=Edaphobacillus lindanitolerans TaxID=550447 RepID=A0A1U7PMD1_9BACI|nr:glutamate 5-kinase [Edaphobacillus lindanitolerans]SIT84162.1 glutamate 5-kinase [Edaphobacillus lindanitolerans]
MKKRRIVVKIGSSSLTDRADGLSAELVSEHTAAIAALAQAGQEVVLVSSGAVAAGFRNLGYHSKPASVVSKQAAAAVGQGLLMEAYTEEFKKHGIITAQLLLTRQDLVNKDRFHNTGRMLEELLKRRAVPIINENDSISVEGITFGDNDMLSALVAGLIHADHLIILTDVNGIYDGNPHNEPEARKYTYIAEVHDGLLKAASGPGSSVGTGGMKSKVLAARIAGSLGVQVFIGTGNGPEKLLDIVEGRGDGTYIGSTSRLSGKDSKRWMAFCSVPSGTLTVDDGAARALSAKGTSLLPVGITGVSGTFRTGDVANVVDPQGNLVGRGQVNYPSDVIEEIIGRTGDEAMKISGGTTPEVIHCNRWIHLQKEEAVR